MSQAMSQNQNYQLAIVEDDPGLRELLYEELESNGYQVTSYGSSEDFLASLSEQQPDLVISDIRLPGMSGMQLLQQLQQRKFTPSVLLITAFGTVSQAVDALKHGADDFLTKPLDLEHLLLSVERLLEHRALREEVSAYRQQRQETPFGIVGQSRAMRMLFQQIKQIAGADGSVLILGESGTGKELVAKALHQQSARSQQPFSAVNCAGIPADLLESEFFGHAAGAFTGAQKARAGLLKEADGGTLLLDEIGEMPLALQAKLLRVLQEGTMRPVGSDQEIRVDVRIIAATHQNLEEKIANGDFRADLFYRLETFSLQVPPLRQRGDDLELLANFFLSDLQKKQPKPVRAISSDAIDTLYQYPFPGNVRELQNAIERAYTFCDGEVIQASHLPERIQMFGASGAGEADYQTDTSTGTELPSMHQLQQQHVQRVMDYTQGNKRQAAEILGVTRRTLYRWLAQEGDQ